jgi:hypothetical protein
MRATGRGRRETKRNLFCQPVNTSEKSCPAGPERQRSKKRAGRLQRIGREEGSERSGAVRILHESVRHRHLETGDALIKNKSRIAPALGDKVIYAVTTALRRGTGPTCRRCSNPAPSKTSLPTLNEQRNHQRTSRYRYHTSVNRSNIAPDLFLRRSA